MQTPKESDPLFIEKEGGPELAPSSAARFRYGSLRSPPLHRAAEHLPQSVTYVVSMKCHLCGEHIQ